MVGGGPTVVAGFFGAGVFVAGFFVAGFFVPGAFVARAAVASDSASVVLLAVELVAACFEGRAEPEPAAVLFAGVFFTAAWVGALAVDASFVDDGGTAVVAVLSAAPVGFLRGAPADDLDVEVAGMPSPSVIDRRCECRVRQ